jgi:integrase
MAFHYKDKNEKTWRIKWYDPLTGKPRSESAKTTIESVAVKLAKKKTAELELGIAKSQLVKAGTNRITLSQAFEEFLLAHNKYTASSIRAHKRAFQNILDVNGDKYCQQYSQTDFDDLLKALTSIRKVPITTHVKKAEIRYREIFLSPNTIANYTRHLSVFFEWLLKKKYILENPIVKQKENVEDPEPIPEADQKRIFDFLLQWNKKHYDLFKLMYLGAYRAGELCAVSSNDFEIDNHVLRVKNFKAKRTDRIPLLKDTKEHFEQMKLSGQITTLGYTGLKSLWSRVLEAANKHYKLSGDDKMKYHLHQIRKSRGTDLANIGVDLLWLHKYMRHTSLEVTRKYYIKVDLNKARNVINERLELTGKSSAQDTATIEPGVLQLFNEVYGDRGNINRIVNMLLEKYLEKKLTSGIESRTKSRTQNTISDVHLRPQKEKLRLVK